MIKNKHCNAKDINYEIKQQMDFEISRGFDCKVISIIPLTYEPKDSGGLKLSDVEIYYEIR